MEKVIKITEKNTGFSEPIRSKKTRISGEKRMGAYSDAHATSGNSVPDYRSESTVLTISIERAATMLGVHRSTLYEAIRSGEFAAIKIGNSVRVSTEHVQKLLAGEQFISLREHERILRLQRLAFQQAYNRKLHMLHIDVEKEILQELEDLK